MRQTLAVSLIVAAALAATIGVGIALDRLGEGARVTYSYTALL